MRRVNPYEVGESQDNYFIHLARYMFAARQLRGHEEVLEVGCGVGYGARLLADFAAQVVATDAERDLRQYWDRYSTPNLQFVEVVPQDQRFDVLVCFEVIEHMPESEAPVFLENLKAKLNSRGMIFLSTPRALPFEQRSRNRQLQHPKEYSPKEFRNLLDRHFRHTLLFGQNDAVISSQNLEMAWNLVAVCMM